MKISISLLGKKIKPTGFHIFITMDHDQAVQRIQNCVKRCRRVARTALIITTVFWFFFALLSGAKEYGGGMDGLMQSLPHALPWLGFIVIIFIAWRWELIGGILLIAVSIFLAFHFNVFEGNATEALMIITPMVMTGFMFIFIWFRIYAAKKSLKEMGY